MGKIGTLLPLLKRLYRDPYARGFLGAGLVFSLGDFVLGIAPREHPDWSISEWLLYYCIFWIILLMAASVLAALDIPSRRAGTKEQPNSKG